MTCIDVVVVLHVLDTIAIPDVNTSEPAGVDSVYARRDEWVTRVLTWDDGMVVATKVDWWA